MNKTLSELWAPYFEKLEKPQIDLVSKVVNDPNLNAKIRREIVFNGDRKINFEALNKEIGKTYLDDYLLNGLSVFRNELQPFRVSFDILMTAVCNLFCETALKDRFFEPDSRYISGKDLSDQIKILSSTNRDCYIDQGRSFWYQGREVSIPDGVSVYKTEKYWEIRDLYAFGRKLRPAGLAKSNIEEVAKLSGFVGAKQLLEVAVSELIDNKKVSLDNVDGNSWCLVGLRGEMVANRSSIAVEKTFNLGLVDERQLTYLVLQELVSKSKIQPEKPQKDKTKKKKAANQPMSLAEASDLISDNFWKMWQNRLQNQSK